MRKPSSNMKSLSSVMRKILRNPKLSKRLVKLDILEIWDDMCNGFFSQGKLIIHDNDYKTLLCHDYALIDFFKTLRISFALIVKDDAIEQIYRKKFENIFIFRMMYLFY